MNNIPVDSINAKFLSLKKDLQIFEREIINSKMSYLHFKEFVKKWDATWFLAAKSVTEAVFNEALPKLETELPTHIPDYFREILIIESTKYFLDNFYKNLTTFITDEYNFYRTLTVGATKFEKTFVINLELSIVDYVIIIDVVFDYYTELTQEKANVGISAKITLSSHKEELR